MITTELFEYFYNAILHCLAYMDSVIIIRAWGYTLSLFGAITSSIIFTCICGLIWQAVTPAIGEDMHDGL